MIVAAGTAPLRAQSILAQPLPPPGGATSAPATHAPAPHPAATHRTHKTHVPVVAAPAGAPRHATSHAAAKPATTKAPAHAAAKPPPPAPAAVAATPAPPRQDPTKGTSTGLPLPRWVSFRSDEVNLRSGPGMQYPIAWVYHRRDYPVQIIREFDVWRLVQDQDGTKGWVHQATLTGRRGFLVTGDGPQTLRASASDTADPVAQLMPGVVGLVRKCPAGSDWCEVQAGGYRGWLQRTATYGVSPSEVIG